MSVHSQDPARYSFALVALPWATKTHPSGALSALSAYISRERPNVDVTIHSEFVGVAAALGDALYEALAVQCFREGELPYMALVYPEKRPTVVAALAAWADEHLDPAIRGEAQDWSATVEDLICILEKRLHELAQELKQCDAVGFTVTFGQTFGSIALTRALKALTPGIKVIFGGTSLADRAGISLFEEYPEIDYAVQGEGEQPIVYLLDTLMQGGSVAPGTPGVLYREATTKTLSPVPLSEVKTMDDLPLPDYTEYAALADVYDFDWSIPMEGSRGCWWDRSSHKGNPKDTCYFCGIPAHWGRYREKSVERVVDEVLQLSDRYQRLRFLFTDSIIRNRDTDRFATALRDSGKELEFFYEMRANVRSHEFVLLWEAGLTSVQIGIEALSTSLLSRIGKGTTTIQNLHAMRLCAEFGVANLSNLITNFPGSTKAELEETMHVLENYALSYHPLAVSGFVLSQRSTVDVLRDEFGILRTRNPDIFKAGLPEDVWERLLFPEMKVEMKEPGVDWTPLVELCKRWHALHENAREPLLRYRDGVSFLAIEDERFDDFRTGTLSGIERDIYLFCTEIRSEKQILERFPESRSQLHELLQGWIESRIAFHESGKYLSLAVASAPHQAARRIRALREEQLARRSMAAEVELEGKPARSRVIPIAVA